MPIIENGPSAYFSTLPIKAMVENMKAKGVPSSVSNTAGTFVCNHIMYGLMHLIDTKYPNTRGGFIHVPFATEQVLDKPNSPSLTIEQIALGLTASIEAVIDNAEDIKVVGGEIS